MLRDLSLICVTACVLRLHVIHVADAEELVLAAHVVHVCIEFVHACVADAEELALDVCACAQDITCSMNWRVARSRWGNDTNKQTKIHMRTV